MLPDIPDAFARLGARGRKRPGQDQLLGAGPAGRPGLSLGMDTPNFSVELLKGISRSSREPRALVNKVKFSKHAPAHRTHASISLVPQGTRG